jgi:hypothetical protein
MELSNAQILEVKQSLCSAVACEIRAFLYESLNQEIGSDRVITLLAIAEKRALKTVRFLPISKLIG